MTDQPKAEQREARRVWRLNQARHKAQRKQWKLARRARRQAKQAGLAFNAPREE